MAISTYESWLELERQQQQRDAITAPQYLQYSIDSQRELDQQRNELLVRFPYSVVAEGSWFEHDYASRWCWQNIGAEDGPCTDWHSEYPACPLVLETKRLEQVTRTDKSDTVMVKKYANPGEHQHEGKWIYLWFGKTGYNYGYGEYYFANEGDCANFITAFPTFTYSEEWD